MAASQYKHVDIRRDRDGHLVELRFHTDDGPFRWTGASGAELAALFGDLARDPDVRVVVMAGTGERFCDLGLALKPMPPCAPEDWERIRWHGESLIMNLLNIQAPVIACINGPVAVHPEIPLLSDIVLAADGAAIQDTGHYLLDIAPTDGLHIFMPLLMGLTRARYFLMTGQRLSAHESLDLGLVNEVMPAGELLPRARELAEELLERNPLVLRYTRLALTHHLKGLCHDLLGYGGALEGLAVIDQGIRDKQRPV